MTPVLLYIYRKPPLRDQRGRKRKSVTVRVGSSRAVPKSGDLSVQRTFAWRPYIAQVVQVLYGKAVVYESYVLYM